MLKHCRPFHAATFAVLAAASLLAGCSTSSAPRGIDYPAPVVAPSRPQPSKPPVAAREWRAAGAGLDAAFERSALLADTFYRNADALLMQVEKSGAMGVNRGWEASARKNGEWFIEEQRFADTVIGAGVNRNRSELIDAGLRAIEWGFAQQSPDGSFPCKDNYLGAAYFVAASGHSIWLLENSGYARNFSGRINALRPALERAARWLADDRNAQPAATQNAGYGSRLILTGYALGVAGRVLGDADLAIAGEDAMRNALAKQHASGYFPERGGFDASFQAEALVYLLRFYDHAATADMRRDSEPAIRRGLKWLESRVNPRGVVLVAGNTRTGFGQERDRTGQYRRVSGVAVSRAFGLARHVLGDSRFEAIAKTVAAAKQPA